MTTTISTKAERGTEARAAEAASARRCGAVGQPDGSVRWRVWAPRAEDVGLILLDTDGNRRTVPMHRERQGFFSHTEADVPDGRRYVLSLDGREDRSDPCSLW